MVREGAVVVIKPGWPGFPIDGDGRTLLGVLEYYLKHKIDELEDAVSGMQRERAICDKPTSA